MLPCLSKQLFNIDCPGCGLQRSLLFIWNGDFLAALKMYPAIYFLILLGILIVFKIVLKKEIIQKAINYTSIISVITILANYFIKL